MTGENTVSGTALSFKQKTVAITGASGSLGMALLEQLVRQGANPVALTSHAEPLTITVDDQPVAIETIQWQVGHEAELSPVLQRVDILILNHGLNVQGSRSGVAVTQSTEVNALSQWRLMELFLSQIESAPASDYPKELWVNTSEAEVSPAFSPLYELSKRLIGDLVTLRRLDSPCIIRKLILGPFKSQLNPVGVLSAPWVARQIMARAQRDQRDIIVTINPLTYLFFPLKELSHSLYFRLFTQANP